MTYIVAVYDSNRAYGGHEEGGWWYDCGELIRTIKVFHSEMKAYDFARKMNGKLDAIVNKGRCELSSVCCNGWATAEVYENIAPAYYPVVKPHYE